MKRALKKTITVIVVKPIVPARGTLQLMLFVRPMIEEDTVGVIGLNISFHK